MLTSADLSVTAALAWSSVVPAVRAVWGLVRERRVNGLALLMLAVNGVGVALGLVTGDARLMLVKESAVSSVLGVAILVSVLVGKPLMTAAAKPVITKGDPAKLAAWARLATGSPEFRRSERTFSLVWGVVLVADCAARIVGVYTLPVATMVWLGTLIVVGAMVLAVVVGGRFGAGPMATLVAAETRNARR